jgi:hypothetical protein
MGGYAPFLNVDADILICGHPRRRRKDILWEKLR